MKYTVSYTELFGKTFIVDADSEEVEFPKYCMRSGGSVWFDDEWHEYVATGEWSVKVPEQYADIKNEIERCVNENVEWGCCGGCV